MTTVNQTQSPNLDLVNAPRIYLVTQQLIQRLIARCMDYEFADMINEVDDDNVLALHSFYGFQLD
jgi:hypothetical protein